jgi:hypothetical protein
MRVPFRCVIMRVKRHGTAEVDQIDSKRSSWCPGYFMVSVSWSELLSKVKGLQEKKYCATVRWRFKESDDDLDEHGEPTELFMHNFANDSTTFTSSLENLLCEIHTAIQS